MTTQAVAHALQPRLNRSGCAPDHQNHLGWSDRCRTTGPRPGYPLGNGCPQLVEVVVGSRVDPLAVDRVAGFGPTRFMTQSGIFRGALVG